MPEVHLLQRLDATASSPLLDFCLECGVNRFTVTARYSSEAERRRVERDIFERLAPASTGRRCLEQTVTQSSRGDGGLADVECWRFDAMSLPLILELSGGSLTSYRFGGPEDWTFFRDDDLFFGVVSHEQFAFLRLRDDELETFRLLGLRYRVK